MQDSTYYVTPATVRVVRLTNVHYDATEEDIRQFFQGYTVIDQIRATNPRVGKKSSVYAMFSTIQDRNTVVANSQNRYIRGRRVNIMRAPTGNYAINTTHDGFVRPGNYDTGSTPATQASATIDLVHPSFPALSVIREEEARLRRGQIIPIREEGEALARQNKFRREERECAEFNQRDNDLALVSQRRAMGRARRRRRYKDHDSSKEPPVPAPVPVEYRVPSPDLENSEDPRNRVLLITDIPTEADNDAVMTFLQEYRPEAIDRTQVGGNWMVSALVLMQTVEGRDRAVEQLSGRMIRERSVLVHNFSNLTQEVLDRIMNPETSVPDIAAESSEQSEAVRSPVPPIVSAPYAPFGISNRLAVTSPASGPRVANPPAPSSTSTSYSPFGSSNPISTASPAPEPSHVASILGDTNLNQGPTQAPSAQTYDLPTSSTDESIRVRMQRVPPGRISPGPYRPSAPVFVQPRQAATQPSWMWRPSLAESNTQPAPNNWDFSQFLPLPPAGRYPMEHFSPILPGRSGAPRRDRRLPPGINITSRINLLDYVMHTANIPLNPTPHRGVIWGRGNQTANGNRGGGVVFQDGRDNFHANQARGRGRGRGRGECGRGRGRENGTGNLDDLSGNPHL